MLLIWFVEDGYHLIPTESSRPHYHPRQINEEIIKRIIDIRLQTNRTSEVVHQHLLNGRIKVFLNCERLHPGISLKVPMQLITK